MNVQTSAQEMNAIIGTQTIRINQLETELERTKAELDQERTARESDRLQLQAIDVQEIGVQ